MSYLPRVDTDVLVGVGSNLEARVIDSGNTSPAGAEPALEYLKDPPSLGAARSRRESLRRELRVMFSGNRSPTTLRVAKWAVFLGIARRLHGTRWFAAWVLGLPLAGVAVHLLYRRKTRNWTRPWGGWNDVATANRKGRRGAGA